MSLYPTVEEIANVNAGYLIPEGVDAVLFRRANGKIGVCANATMTGGVWCRKVDWKAIKVMAELKFPGFTKLNFRLKKHRYFQLMRQAAYLVEKTGLPPYSEKFYLPHFVDDDGLLVYEARGSNFSLAGSFPDYQLDDDGPYGVDGVVVVGRWQGVRRWFARLRDRMRR